MQPLYLGSTIQKWEKKHRIEGPGESMDTSELSGKSSGAKMIRMGEFPGSPVVKTSLSSAGVWVQSLVMELRLCMPWGQKS